jgi:hypothetical protein
MTLDAPLRELVLEIGGQTEFGRAYRREISLRARAFAADAMREAL